MEPVGALEGPVEYTLTLSLLSVHWTCCLHTSPCATTPYPPIPHQHSRHAPFPTLWCLPDAGLTLCLVAPEAQGQQSSSAQIPSSVAKAVP